MPFNAKQARDAADELYRLRQEELPALNLIRRYWKGRQKLPALIPTAVNGEEIRIMARASRVNVMPLVVNSLVQSTFVDGFRVGRDENNAAGWNAWQANKMDARQTALHRATAAYGAAYVIVLPGDPLPVIRPVSPRNLTAAYGEDPDWPMLALQPLGRNLWRLFDETHTYYLKRTNLEDWEFVESRVHGFEVGAPIVRFLDEEDLDADDEVAPDDSFGERGSVKLLTRGQIGPLAPLQDQLDLTTFDLQISQHYGAFKQRYIIGWVAEDERDAVKTAASQFVTIDADAQEVKVGEWAQTELEGYLKSRDQTLNHVVSLAQLPPHELSGDARLVNLSAEALAAAEASKDRKVGERKTIWGESHEQTFWAVGRYTGEAVPDDAQVSWRETSARSFAATVDGLGKLSQMLGIPPQELWERVPGATKQDVDRWKAAYSSGNAFEDLARILDRQAA